MSGPSRDEEKEQNIVFLIFLLPGNSGPSVPLCVFGLELTVTTVFTELTVLTVFTELTVVTVTLNMKGASKVTRPTKT